MAKTKIKTRTKNRSATRTAKLPGKKAGRPAAAGKGPAKRTPRAPRASRPAADAAPRRTGVATDAPAADATAARLPRDPKGRRAQFYQDPAIDQLWAVVTAVTAEVSVAFDRLDTLERLLERDGRVTRETIEAYRPDESAAAERARRREELIQRVFQVLSQYGR